MKTSNTNTLSVAAFSKTGKRVRASSRAARTFRLSVVDGNGSEWLGRSFDSLHGALSECARLRREAGPVSRWDRDVFSQCYEAA